MGKVSKHRVHCGGYSALLAGIMSTIPLMHHYVGRSCLGGSAGARSPAHLYP